MSTPQERLKIWRQEQEAKTAEGRRRIWRQERPQPAPQPQPAQEPEGIFSSFQTGVAGPLLRNVVETAADFYNAPGETLERVGRGALEFAAAFDPAGNAYKPTVEGQAARVAELNRRADERLPEPIKSIKAGMAIEEAKPRTRAGRVAGVVGSVLGEIAFPTAPETVAGNIVTAPFGASAARSAGKVVAPILQRIRAGRNVPVRVAEPPPTGIASQIRRTGAVEAAEGASIRAQSGVARLESPTPTRTLPTRQNLAEGPPPLLEEAGAEEFAVSLGKARESAPGARGPRYDEAVELELRKQADPSLVTKEERTPVLQTIGAFIKAGLLTKPTTHLKNVAGTGLFQLSEEAARIPASIADMVVSPLTKMRTTTGPSAGSMGRSFRALATEGLEEAKQAIKTGRTKFDIEGLQEINSGSKLINKYVNGVFRTLKAEDAVFRAYATRRALEGRAKAVALTEMRQGKITRGEVGQRAKELIDNPTGDLEAGAIADAEMAVFANDNFISTEITGPLRQRLQNSAKYPKFGKGVDFTIDRIIPFVKTPTNVIARMLEYSPYGLVKSGVQAARLARGVLKGTFTEAQQRAFAMTFGRGSIGSGIVALGWLGYKNGWMTGLQEDDPSRKARDLAAGRTPGSIKIGGNWYQVIGAAPLGSLLAIGATLARETEQEREGTGILPILETAGQAISEQPLMIGTKQVAEAVLKPGSVGERLVGGIAASAIPSAVSGLADAFDPTAREAKGITGPIQSRIPGARNLLPEAVDAAGQPRQDFGPLQAFFDPTRATTDVATQSSLFRELVRLDAGIAGFQREEGEPDDAYRAKVQAFGQLYTRYGQQLVSSPVYQRANDEIKLRAVKSLNDRAKDAAREGRTAPGNLAPAALIGAAIGAEARENRKNAGRKQWQGINGPK